MTDLIKSLIPFIIAIIASFIGSYGLLKYISLKKMRPLNKLINIKGEKLIFIFPHREPKKPDPNSILPRTATEDFLAINNFISALLLVGWNHKIISMDTDHAIDAIRNENLVTICSPKSNSFTKELQNVLLEKGYNKMYIFSESETGWMIKDEIGQYISDSYNQMKKYKESRISRKELAQQQFDDVAVITKVINPWNSVNHIFIIAGVRGVGTWGAAECIKKKWKEIYYHPHLKDKTGEFSALLRITYKDFDIVNIKVHEVRQPLR